MSGLEIKRQEAIVAAVQFKPELLDVHKNIATAQQLAFEAAAKGASVVVLPELSLSGQTIRDLREAADVCQEQGGYQTAAFRPIAARFNCHIVFGYVELAEGKFYNSAAVVGPAGLVANAQKHNLWGSDNMWAQPSEQLAPVVTTRAGRLGILICRDASNKYRESYEFYKPDHRFYRRGSVDTIALLTNWGDSYAYPDSSWIELVESTRANLIVSNRTGKERDMKFKGGSCVVDRQRKIQTFGSSFTENAVVGGTVIL